MWLRAVQSLVLDLNKLRYTQYLDIGPQTKNEKLIHIQRCRTSLVVHFWDLQPPKIPLNIKELKIKIWDTH
jgi:hypothetical protein